MFARYRQAVVGAALSCAALASSAAAQDANRPEVWLTSLHWPPFTGPDLLRGGASKARLGTLLWRAGYTLRTDFLPWSRAMRDGLSEPRYIGYYPEYLRDDVDCLWSAPFDLSVVGFVEGADSAFTWRTVADLGPYRIGVVIDYANDNGPFDAAVEAGRLYVQAVTEDALNVRKVAAGRLDAAVIDRDVLAWLLNGELSELRDDVRFDERVLTTNTLHVCFRTDDARAAAVHAALNAVITLEEGS